MTLCVQQLRSLSWMPNEMGIWEQGIDTLDNSRFLRGCAGVLFLLCVPLATADFIGPVVSVLDGNTIDIPTAPMPHQKCTSRHLLAHRTI